MDPSKVITPRQNKKRTGIPQKYFGMSD